MKTAVMLSFTLAALFSLSACEGDGGNRLTEKSRIEGEAQAKEQLKKDRELLEEQTKKQKELQDAQVENERKLQSEQIAKERHALDARAKSMERSLTKLHDFYEENSGVYEGTMTRGSDVFSIRITLYPNIPRTNDVRVRTPAEIEADLTLLAYHAQILQWIPPSKDSVGCRITGLRPNTRKGTLQIISPDCPSTYSLELNRTTIAGTAQSENHPDPFEIYAARVVSKKRK